MKNSEKTAEAGSLRQKVRQFMVILLIVALAGPGSSSFAQQRRPPVYSQSRTAAPSRPQRLNASQKKALERYLNEGKRLFREGRYQEAEARFTEALRLSPQSAPLYVGRGWVRASMGQEALASADFRQAQLLDPNLAEGYMGAAEIHKAQVLRSRTRNQVVRAYISAERVYKKAVGLRPNDPHLLYGYATTVLSYFSNPASDQWGKTNSFNAAVRYLTRAIELKPDYAEAYLARALALVQLGNSAMAVRDADQAIRMMPDNPEAYYVRGELASRSPNRNSALPYARKALELDPGNPRYRRALEEWQRPAPPNLTKGEMLTVLIGLTFLAAFAADMLSPSSGSSRSQAQAYPSPHRRWADVIDNAINMGSIGN